MKHYIFYSLIAICLYLALGMSSIYSLSNPSSGDSVPPGDSTTIIEVIDANRDVGELLIIHLDDQIPQYLPSTISGVTGANELIQCPVTWDISTITTPGKQDIRGQVSAPDGYKLASSQLEKVTLTVAIYDDAPVISLPQISSYWFLTKILPLGTSADSLYLHHTYELVDKDGDVVTGPIKWDYNNLDINRTGMYTIYGTPILSDGAAFEETASPISQNIYVMRADKLDLGAFYVLENEVVCSWLTRIDPSLAVLEVSLDGTQWGSIDSVLPDYADYTLEPTNLTLDTASLQEDVDYYFRINYDGTPTDALHVKYMVGVQVPIVDMGGNRDGGGDSQEMPSVSQSAPGGSAQSNKDTSDNSAKASGKTPSNPTQKNSDTVEKESNTHIVYSGLRLRTVCELHDKVDFQIHGITVSFDSDDFSKFQLSDDDTFDIRITQPDGNSVSITIKINGTIIDSIPNASVHIPHETENTNADFYVTKKSEEEKLDATYNGKEVSFVINRTGTYYIHEVGKSTAQISTGDLPAALNPFLKVVFGVLLIILIGGIGLGIYWRIKWKKQK